MEIIPCIFAAVHAKIISVNPSGANAYTGDLIRHLGESTGSIMLSLKSVLMIKKQKSRITTEHTHTFQI